jgi:hypothetical protein
MIIHYKLTKSLTNAAEQLLRVISEQHDQLYTDRQANPPENLKALSDFYHSYRAEHMPEAQDTTWLN